MQTSQVQILTTQHVIDADQICICVLLVACVITTLTQCDFDHIQWCSHGRGGGGGGGGRGQSATPDSEEIAKSWEKSGKIEKKEEKLGRKCKKQEGSFSLPPPPQIGLAMLLTTSYLTMIWACSHYWCIHAPNILLISVVKFYNTLAATLCRQGFFLFLFFFCFFSYWSGFQKTTLIHIIWVCTPV